MSSPRSSLSDELESLVGRDGLACDEHSRQKYGRDETEDLFFAPDVVLLPRDASQVAAVLALASREGVPVTPRGGGTGLSGGALPVSGGWVLSLERLNRVRRIDEEDLLVEAEAGVILADLQRAVEPSGLFYPPDPASRESCTLGGTIGENAAGPRSCKYGTTRRWVLGIEAALANGTLIRTGGRTRKDVAGYDLTQLLVGSEGTLAVVTAATLALAPQPRCRVTLAISFSDLTAAASAVAVVFRLGFEPAACELLERRALELVAGVEDVPPQLLGSEALLLIELDGGSTQALLERASELAEALKELADAEPLVALDSTDQRRLWNLREQVGPAVKKKSRYKEADTVVPRSALGELIRSARKIAAEEGLEAVAYGHAGDGNLHINLLRGDLGSEDWELHRTSAERRLFAKVASLGGSVSGEHGIGWTQRDFLPLVRSPDTIDVMRAIKRAFDPGGILNPAKIFPPR